MDPVDRTQTSVTLLVLLQDPANASAWQQFALRYRPALLRWCRGQGLQEAEAEDVAQELLMEIHQKLANFVYDPARGRFQSWLKTVACRACLDFVRKRNRQRAVGDSVVAFQLDGQQAQARFEAELERTFAQETLETALAGIQPRVSPHDWLLFQQVTLEERPAGDVAAEQNLSVAAVYMATMRVRKLLKQELERQKRIDHAEP